MIVSRRTITHPVDVVVRYLQAACSVGFYTVEV